MSQFKEVDEVMKRIEEVKGTKSGRFLVKGTMLIKGEEILRSSLDNTTSESLRKCICEKMKNLCNLFVREQDPDDEIEFIRIDYKEKATRDSRFQIMLAQEGECDALVVQEYKVRDLRVRPKEQKDTSGYLYVQRNFFYPTLDR